MTSNCAPASSGRATAGPAARDWPNSRYLRAALALAAAYVDFPESQVEAAFELVKRSPSRMWSLYLAVTKGRAARRIRPGTDHPRGAAHRGGR